MTKEELRLQRPRGTRDYLPHEARLTRALEAEIREVFRLWGYAEVITPTFEYIDVLRQGTGSESDEMIFRFFDREGHTLGLRSDATTPIARLVAARFADTEAILRLSYLTSIFRYVEPGMGHEREFHQAGVELIGSAKPEADAEAIQLAAEVFGALGIRGYRLDIGEISFIQGVLADSGLSPKEQRTVRTALLNKDFVQLQKVLSIAAIPAERKEQLTKLSRLRGGVGVLEQARALTANETALHALTRLQEVCRLLSPAVQDRVQVDLGMLKDLDYYTGVIFEGYVSDFGYTVCTGGRYDRLIGGFGSDKPATGFAFGLERLVDLVDYPDDSSPTVVLSYSAARRAHAQELATLLRNLQITAILQLDGADKPAAAHLEILAPDSYRIRLGDTEATLASAEEVKAFLTGGK